MLFMWYGLKIIPEHSLRTAEPRPAILISPLRHGAKAFFYHLVKILAAVNCFLARARLLMSTGSADISCYIKSGSLSPFFFPIQDSSAVRKLLFLSVCKQTCHTGSSCCPAETE